MDNYYRKYNKQQKRILFGSLYELYNFVNWLGGDLDIPKCGRNSVRYTIATHSGHKDLYAGGFSNAKKLFETFNELYDLNIDVMKSGRSQSLFRVVFNETPNKLIKEEEANTEEKIDGEVTEYGKEETQQEDSTEDHSAGTEQVSSEPDQKEQPEEPDEIGVSEDSSDERGMGRLGSIGSPGSPEEPDWDKICLPRWSKKKVKELAKDLDLEVDSKLKFQDMVNDLKQKFEDKYNLN